MHGPRWMWLAAVVLLAGMVDCKCGEKEEKTDGSAAGGPQERAGYESTVSSLPGASRVDVTSVMPRGAALVLVAGSVDRLAGWLESKPWFQEAKASPVFQDLVFSDAWFRLSTVKHRIESMSAVRLERTGLKELMATPTGLAIRPSAKGREFLLVKQIDLKVQALDRLVEVLNQIHPRAGTLTSREVDGLHLRTLRLDDESELHYLLFSNLLLMSNNESYLLQAVALARGEEKTAIDADPRMGGLLRKAAAADLVLGMDLANWSRGEERPWWGNVLRAERLVLALHTGDAPRLDVLADASGQAGVARVGWEAGKLVPLDSRLVLGLSGIDWKGIWTSLEGKLDEPGRLPPRLRNKVARSLIPSLGDQSVLVLGGVDTGGTRTVPRAALLVRIAPGSEERVAEATLDLFSFLFGAEPGLRSLDEPGGKKIRVMQGSQAFRPGFTLLDGWLVVSTGGNMLERVVSTAAGKQPAITDVPGFADKVMPTEGPVYAVSYLDCGLFFGDLASYAAEVVVRGKRFDRSTLAETVDPLWKALARIGRLGGNLRVDKQDVTGRVVPL